MNPTALVVYACSPNFGRLERVAALAECTGTSIAQTEPALLLTAL